MYAGVRVQESGARDARVHHVVSHDDRVASRVIMFELLRECAGGRFVGYLHIVVHGTTCIGCTLQMLASIVSDVRDAHGIGTAAAWQQYDSLICTALALHLQESGRKAASQPTQQLSWYLYSNSASWPSYTVAISVTARHEARHGIGTAAAYTPYGSGTAAARQRHGSDTAAAWLLHGCGTTAAYLRHGSDICGQTTLCDSLS